MKKEKTFKVYKAYKNENNSFIKFKGGVSINPYLDFKTKDVYEETDKFYIVKNVHYSNYNGKSYTKDVEDKDDYFRTKKQAIIYGIENEEAQNKKDYSKEMRVLKKNHKEREDFLNKTKKKYKYKDGK